MTKTKKIITELTEEQKARFPEFIAKWVAIGLCTKPAERQKAESALGRLYTAAKLTIPRMYWLPDPILGAMAARAYMLTALALRADMESPESIVEDGGLGSTCGEVAEAAVDVCLPIACKVESLNDERRTALYTMVAAAMNGTLATVWPKANVPSKRKRVARFAVLAQQIADKNKSEITSAGIAYFGGSLWAAYPAWADYFNLVCGVKIDRSYLEMTESCGFYWTISDTAFLTERPSQINRDDRGRLHSFDGFAISYSSWGLFYIHGVAVSGDIVMNPSSITVKRIEEERNLEVKRIMINRYGLSKFMADSKAIIVQTDDYGDLMRKEVPGDEAIVMVKLVNSTAEPDGTFKDYFLRVPPTIKTAREGVAWSFSKEESHYAPAFES